MNHDKSIIEGLKKIKTQKMLIILGLFVGGFVLVSWLFAPEDKNFKNEAIPVVNSDNVDFNVKLDTVQKKVSAIFSEREAIEEKENNPFEKKKEHKKLEDELNKLDNLGETKKTKKNSNPYKNDDMWELDTPSSETNLGLEKALTPEEERLLRIEEKRKLREERRSSKTSKNNGEEKIEIRAYVYRPHLVLPNDVVELTLVTPFTYKGKYYDAGFEMKGIVKGVKNNRVFMVVEKLVGQTVNLKAYDPGLDSEGLLLPRAGILEQELKGELQKGGLEEAAKLTKSQIARAITTVINSNRRDKLTKVPLDNDYEMVLRNY
ncbi:hypothetical protein HN014_22410 (plasmid) [Aquimarina sp. TRL1]|uniref:conjugative transposon protein TraM n=1 Tax=Aquimarina sp. (strain TRL1) TaxID=2736252 RepID=UPI00158A3822|nr:hypothetical protein [Aquimarina sp. TRL1]QKX07755.1 hypothetical protein HN014_22410 [Aquimarina sp. TRL1]